MIWMISEIFIRNIYYDFVNLGVVLDDSWVDIIVMNFVIGEVDVSFEWYMVDW